MKDFGRIENQRLDDAKLVEFNVKTMVDQVLEILERRSGAKKFDFAIDIARNITSLVGDRSRIQQVLLSILENSIYEAGNEGVIHIKLLMKPLSNE